LKAPQPRVLPPNSPQAWGPDAKGVDTTAQLTDPIARALVQKTAKLNLRAYLPDQLIEFFANQLANADMARKQGNIELSVESRSKTDRHTQQIILFFQHLEQMRACVNEIFRRKVEGPHIPEYTPEYLLAAGDEFAMVMERINKGNAPLNWRLEYGGGIETFKKRVMQRYRDRN